MINQRKALDNIKPYTPVKPLWEVKKKLELTKVVKLASNENPLGPSPKSLDAITRSLSEINRSPDAHALELKSVIASRLSLSIHELMGAKVVSVHFDNNYQFNIDSILN